MLQKKQWSVASKGEEGCSPSSTSKPGLRAWVLETQALREPDKLWLNFYFDIQTGVLSTWGEPIINKERQ